MNFVRLKSNKKKSNLNTLFKCLKDPKINRKKLHSLKDIIRLVIIGIICGADSRDAIEEFGTAKKDFLSTFLTLQKDTTKRAGEAISSHDIINRVFCSINPKKFELAFISWVNSLKNKEISIEVITLGGKTVKGSKDSFHGSKAIHLVYAWACSNELVLC